MDNLRRIGRGGRGHGRGRGWDSRGRGRGGQRGRGELRGRGEWRGGARPKRSINGSQSHVNELKVTKVTGQSRRSDGKNSRTMDFEWLEKNQNETPENIVIALSGNLLGLEELLRGDRGDISLEWTRMMLDVFGKMLDCEDLPRAVTDILLLIVGSDFHTKTIILVHHLLMKNSGPKARADFLNCLKLMNHLLTILPNQSEKKVSMTLSILQAKIDDLHEMLDVQEAYNEVKTSLDNIQKRHSRTRKRGKAKVAGLTTMEKLHAQAPPDNFRDIPVFPRQEDFQDGSTPFLRSNLTDKAYQDIDHYLDVQYRLLREDYIRPLRNGDLKGRKVRFENIKVYEDVTLLFVKPDRRGMLYKIHFNPEGFKNVRWQNTKRLLQGNLLCLSSDQFQKELYFAVVADRLPDELVYGHLTVLFVCKIDAKEGELSEDYGLQGFQHDERFGPSTNLKKLYTMVETDAYFEAYRHVLAGLQDTKNIPLERYLVRCKRDMRAPKYLDPSMPEKRTYDFSSITGKKRTVDVLGNVWPSPSDLKLNQSQAEALKLALTHELAIIQGPPGTGKTHVGLKIMQILLANKSRWSKTKSPILVVCYTNHALDQFLEGIAKFSSENQVIIRVGGRCKNEATQKFALSKVRQERSPKAGKKKFRKAVWDVKNQLNELEELLKERISVLEASLHCVQSLKGLESSIPRRLLNQFSEIESLHAVLSWLGLHDGAGDQKAEETKRATEVIAMENGNETLMEEASWLQEQRILDTDRDQNFEKRRNADCALKRTIEKMDAVPFEELLKGDALRKKEGEWQQNPRDKRKAKRQIHQQFRKTTIMSDAEERMIYSIYSLTIEDRWRLYRTWVSRGRSNLSNWSDELMMEYNRLAKRLEELRRLEDMAILQGADVIAVTTTGAAKYRDLIYKLNSKIVVVEEAAEVLEAHIITSMPKTTQHLILIGDHQQLKPSPTVYELARHYDLDTSLFERMMKVRIPHVTLNIQHRMRPEIADLIRPRIYKELHDHESVSNREGITGIKKSMFFISHNVAEENLEDGKSKKNLHEAAFLAKLCEYLLMQGHKAEEITILTMYTGQLLAFRDRMKEQLVRVTAVDNFQGEESNIILLSLVRSNDQASIGFLGIENRICVALSRAKFALYCIGDMDLLATKSSMWRNIKTHLDRNDSIGESLILQCKNHPEKLTPVKSANDFKNVPEGGCGQKCLFRFDCGHACPRLCHPDDHSKCLKKCLKNLDCGHECQKKCWEECIPCNFMVEKILPKCGHERMVPCGKSPDNFKCFKDIEVDLTCGHKLEIKCFKSDKVDSTWCRENIPDIPKCGHERLIPCTKNPDTIPCYKMVEVNLTCGHKLKVPCRYSEGVDKTQCKEKCHSILDCGHSCRGSCGECFQGRLHKPCKKLCEKSLACGHECRSTCSSTSYCPPCERQCERSCVHGECGKKCREPCSPCQEKCTWKCPHYECTKLCSEPCNRPHCNEPCPKTIEECDHPCIGLCGEPCPALCRVCNEDLVKKGLFGAKMERDTRFIKLEDCGHVLECEFLDRLMNDKGESDSAEMKKCPWCKTAIWSSTRYGNIVNQLIKAVEEEKVGKWQDEIDISTIRDQLIERMQSSHMEEKHFKTQLHRILRALEAEKYPRKIDVHEKAFTRLQKLSHLKEARSELSTYNGDTFEYTSVFDRDLEDIIKWVMLERSHTTRQEDEGFLNETRRLEDILKCAKRKEHPIPRMLFSSDDGMEPSLSELKQLLLKSCTPYVTEKQNQVKHLLHRISKEGSQTKPVSEIACEEQETMPLGHINFATKRKYRKCLKGHIYSIREDDSGIVTSICPFCESSGMQI